MHWTNEKPTVPGFYWLTDDQDVQVVEVVRRPGTLVVWEPRGAAPLAVANYESHLRWAGPLVMPGKASAYTQADAINRAAEALEKIAERLDSWDSATGATKLDVRAKDV